MLITLGAERVKLISKQFNPLSPNSDKHLISPYNIPTWSNTQVMRKNEMITKHAMSWCLLYMPMKLVQPLPADNWRTWYDNNSKKHLPNLKYKYKQEIKQQTEK